MMLGLLGRLGRRGVGEAACWLQTARQLERNVPWKSEVGGGENCAFWGGPKKGHSNSARETIMGETLMGGEGGPGG